MQSEADTRQRLIDVAAEIFASKGFSGASVREICDRASANPASINYHFKSKFEFYKTVLISSFDRLGSARPMPQLKDASSPEQAFRDWIRWYMYRVLSDSNASIVSRLIAAELRDPTEAFDLLVQKSMRPLYEVLQQMICALLNLGPDSKVVQRATLSVIGQCLIYVFAAPMINKLHGHLEATDEEIDSIAEQISEFALAGLKSLRQ